MESNPISSGIKISGNLSSDSTILFSNIFNLFPDSFQNLIPLLSIRYRLAVYTDEDFGENVYIKKIRHNSLQECADDLIDCLEKNRLSNMIYIAHSVNGLLAFLAGTKAPHLFDKIILINAFPYLQYDSIAHCLGNFQEINGENLFSEVKHSEKHDAADQQKSIAQFTDLLASSFSNMHIEKAKAIFNMLITTDCRSLLSHFEIPTMILQAGGDKISTTETGYFMHRTIPDSQLVKLKVKGHLPQLHAAEEIVRAMNFFMPSPVY